MVTAGIAKVISYLGMLASAQMCRTEVQLRGTVCVCKTLGLISRMEKKKARPPAKRMFA